MVLTAGKIKCYVSSFLLFYFLYLYTYKCVQLKETTLEHVGNTVFHPLDHHHNAACEVVYKAEAFVQPYINVVHTWLDENVHSHPLFVEYKVEDKITCARTQIHKVIDPLSKELFYYVSLTETYIYDQLLSAYNFVLELIGKAT